MASKQYKIIQRKLVKNKNVQRKEERNNPVRRKAVQVIFRDVRPCSF